MGFASVRRMTVGREENRVTSAARCLKSVELANEEQETSTPVRRGPVRLHYPSSWPGGRQPELDELAGPVQEREGG